MSEQKVYEYQKILNKINEAIEKDFESEKLNDLEYYYDDEEAGDKFIREEVKYQVNELDDSDIFNYSLDMPDETSYKKVACGEPAAIIDLLRAAVTESVYSEIKDHVKWLIFNEIDDRKDACPPDRPPYRSISPTWKLGW